MTAPRPSDQGAPPAGLVNEPPAGLVRAQRVAVEIAELAADVARPGMTERELARWAEEAMRTRGSTGLWTIVNVGFGAGTLRCFPTEPPTERMLWDIDVAHIDVHPVVDGWWGDCTRTFTAGDEPTYTAMAAEIARVHDQVLGAARPGMPACELWAAFDEAIDQDAWSPLDRLGNIGHSIGRGVSYTQGYIDRNNTTPMWGAWAVEPFIGNQMFGVKSEDVIWFGPDTYTVLR